MNKLVLLLLVNLFVHLLAQNTTSTNLRATNSQTDTDSTNADQLHYRE